MGKRIGCWLLAAVLTVMTLLPAGAASITDVSDTVPSPVIQDSAERDTGTDRVITLSYTAGTEAISSDEPWILREIVVFCEVSADGQKWATVKTLSEKSGTFELSLMTEILPVLEQSGAELYRRIYGFDYSLRLTTVTDSISPDGAKRLLAVSDPTASVTFRCPEFSFIDCSIPADAEMEKTFSAFSYYPNEREVTLPYPTRPGYFFAGWINRDTGKYTETAPAGVRYYRVVAEWDPRTYAVNYVLSTVDDPRFSYTFGRADNSKNPTKHTVGNSEKVEKIKSPVGGFAFDGWYMTADFSGKQVEYIPEDLIGDLILYAKWITFEELEARTADEKEAKARELKYGDLDDDGYISAADARLALRLSVGLEKELEKSKELLDRADIFNTGIVTSANARTILRIAVGLDSLYEVLKASGLIGSKTLDKV